jgi:hypothetical protein
MNKGLLVHWGCLDVCFMYCRSDDVVFARKKECCLRDFSRWSIREILWSYSAALNLYDGDDNGDLRGCSCLYRL